jgi:hypothetical protein
MPSASAISVTVAPEASALAIRVRRPVAGELGRGFRLGVRNFDGGGLALAHAC